MYADMLTKIKSSLEVIDLGLAAAEELCGQDWTRGANTRQKAGDFLQCKIFEKKSVFTNILTFFSGVYQIFTGFTVFHNFSMTYKFVLKRGEFSIDRFRDASSSFKYSADGKKSR